MSSRPRTRPRLETLEGRALPAVAPTLAWVPNDAQFSSQYALNNTGQSGFTADADIDAPEAWSSATATRVPVGVVDTGIDYTHPDLYLNVWLNQGEIPPALRPVLIDTNGDGKITFRDLNDARNQGPGKITDLNRNGYIDAADVLKPVSAGGWADGVSNNGDRYVDDLVGWNFVNDTNNPLDDHGHGTHISGTIGAAGNNGIGVSGVAWNAQLMALKVFDAHAASQMPWVVAAMDYAAAMGAKVINASWVLGAGSSTLAAAIDRARGKGVLVVAAAGNSGVNVDTTAQYPANSTSDNVLTVAATDAWNNLAAYSNYGRATVDLAAPGSNILSTNPGKSYGYRTGTSMAAPFVTGAAALVWGLRPEWTYKQVMNQLLDSVDRLPSLATKTVSGGRLNLAAAVKVPPRGVAPPAFVPAPTPVFAIAAVPPAPSKAKLTAVDRTPPAKPHAPAALDTFFASIGGRTWLRHGRRLRG